MQARYGLANVLKIINEKKLYGTYLSAQDVWALPRIIF